MTILELTAVVKDYRGLRPLRIERLDVDSSEQVAILGIDEPAAEILVNLLTGAAIPDRGAIRVFDQATDAITDSASWLSFVDRFGIVSPRAVLLEGLSVVQNLAIPFSLDIEPPPDAIKHQAIAIAREVGLTPTEWDRRVAEIEAASRVRVLLGRALALDPAIVLMEHPTARVPRDAVVPLGRDIRRIVEQRAVAALTLTADLEFANAVAARVMNLEPATGRLTERHRGWFGRFRL